MAVGVWDIRRKMHISCASLPARLDDSIYHHKYRNNPQKVDTSPSLLFGHKQPQVNTPKKGYKITYPCISTTVVALSTNSTSIALGCINFETSHSLNSVFIPFLDRCLIRRLMSNKTSTTLRPKASLCPCYVIHSESAYQPRFEFQKTSTLPTVCTSAQIGAFVVWTPSHVLLVCRGCHIYRSYSKCLPLSEIPFRSRDWLHVSRWEEVHILQIIINQ